MPMNLYSHIYTVWRVIFVGSNFRGKSEKALKLIFVVLNFVIANNQGRGTAAQAMM